MHSLPRSGARCGLGALAVLVAGCAPSVMLPIDWERKGQFLTVGEKDTRPYLCAVGTSPAVGQLAESIATGRGQTALLSFFAVQQSLDDTGLTSIVSGRIPTEVMHYTYFGADGPTALVCADLNLVQTQAQTGEARVEGLTSAQLIQLAKDIAARAAGLHPGDAKALEAPKPAATPAPEPETKSTPDASSEAPVEATAEPGGGAADTTTQEVTPDGGANGSPSPSPPPPGNP